MNSYPLMAWQNWLGADPGPTITHSPDADGYPFANLSDWRDYTSWRSSESGELEVKLDAWPLPGHVMTVDTLALAGHNLAAAGVTGLALSWSDDDASYSPCFPAFTPQSDRVFLKNFSALTKRYFKLTIPSGYTEPPSIGILFIGRATVIPGYPEPGFDPDAQSAQTAAELSRTGRVLGAAERYRRRQITAAFSRLPADFFTESFLPFWEQHGPKPWFFAWDPAGHPDEAYLVRLAEPKFEAPYDQAFRSLSLSLEGLVE